MKRTLSSWFDVPLLRESTPLALLSLCVLVFAPLIPWLGFFWDDWPTMWYLHVLGPQSFDEVFSIDRPLLGQIFRVTTSLFGTSALAWQIFSLAARAAASISFWFLIRVVWPEATRQVGWAALLFVVYPGFRQQPIAVTYSSVWLLMTAFFLSLAATVQAVRRPERSILYTLLALGLSGFVLFSVEYFFGLELVRPLLVWIASRKETHPRRKMFRTFLRWLPYAALMLVFLYWRFAIHETVRGEVQIVEQLIEQPQVAALSVVRTVLEDVFESGILAWVDAFNIPAYIGAGRTGQVVYLAVSLAVATFTGLYLLLLSNRHRQSSEPQRWWLQATTVGLFSLLVAGWPFWATDLPIALRYPWNRFNLAMMFGSTLLVAGLIDRIPVSRSIKVAFLAVLVGLSAGLHFQQANEFRREWNIQKDFFWQLTWRAPSIEPGTTLVSSDLPFVYFSDNSLTAPLNWTYAPEFQGTQMPYMLHALEVRLGGRIPDLQPDLPIYQPYRATFFEGSTSQMIGFYYSPPSCVRVLDASIDRNYPQKLRYLEGLLPLSRPDLIQPEPVSAATPPQSIFGAEPEHAWCYYYEKADLARQQGDWEAVTALGDEALALRGRLARVNAPELIVFLEGYAREGDWSNAWEVTQQAYTLDPSIDRMLCDNWQRILEDLQADTEQTAALESILACPEIRQE